MNKGIKYKLYPTKDQESVLLQMVGNSRFVWNRFLSYNRLQYERKKEFIFYYDMANYLPKLKEKYGFLELSNSQSLQQTLGDLDKAIKASFKSGLGFPKFKKKGHSDSIRIPQWFRVNKGSIAVPKVGRILLNKHCPLNGTPKNLTIYKEGESWYCSVCVEFDINDYQYYNGVVWNGESVGLDLGTKKLITLSNGKYFKPFTCLSLEQKIKTAQRSLSRRIKGSKSWLKTKAFLGKLYRKLKNKRQDYLHKVSTYLVRSYDLICVENLNIKGMSKSSKGTLENPGKNVKQKSGLNRSILGQGWSILLRMLDYKALWSSKEIKGVDPKNTSRECSRCGFTHKHNRHGLRFKCLGCGFSLDADWNAARNVLARGLA